MLDKLSNTDTSKDSKHERSTSIRSNERSGSPEKISKTGRQTDLASNPSVVTTE